MACVIMHCYNDNVSFTRRKRVNKNIILHYTSSRKTSFHAKVQTQCLQQSPNKIRKKITSEGINQDLCAHFLEVPEFFTKVQEELENVLEKVNYSPTHAGKLPTCVI